MRTRDYHVNVSTPLGPRAGELRLRDEGGAVTGTFELLGKTQSFTGTLGEDGALEIEGELATLLSTLCYRASGRLEGDGIEMEIRVDKGFAKGVFPLTGSLVGQPGTPAASADTSAGVPAAESASEGAGA